MKSIVCTEPGKLIIEERPDPTPPKGWVTLKMKRVGLCGTDFHIFKGLHPFLEYPRVMGHELSGEILETPRNGRFSVGDKVIINPYLSCDNCVSCKKSKSNCCVNLKVLGVHTDGGMCEFLCLPERAIYSARGLTLTEAAMVEFLSIGAHAVSRGQLLAGSRILVIGAGPIGLGVALFASFEEASAVAILDVNMERVVFAENLSDAFSGFVVDDDVDEKLREFTKGDMFDVVFDATGNAQSMEKSLDYTSHGGACVFVSVVKDKIRFSDPFFHAREMKIIGSRNANRIDFENVIDKIHSGKIPSSELNSHNIDLLDLPKQLPTWIENGTGLVKAIAHL